MGGKRPGAGRPKGAPNKRKRELDAGIAASGMDPLDYMLAVMRSPKSPPALRFEAAKRAAPYRHPKLASIEHTGKDGGPIETRELSPIELAQRISFALARAAKALSDKEK
jgi:hypothetical protein